MTDDDRATLGPLALLLGTWVGDKGDDVALADDRSRENNQYREEMSFVATGRVDNHEQILYGLRYATRAWRLGEDNPFHEELGYWMWDARARQVMRCFIIPRGITVLAGGTVEADARRFHLAAEAGSDTYGICSNPFLVAEFKTVSYQLDVELLDADTLRYHEDSVLAIKGQAELFHHTDGNTLRRTS
jgi:hypothetical protein